MRSGLFIVLLALSACTGTITGDSGSDGGTTGGGDGGGGSCTTPGACPCNTNYDCPAGFFCHAESEGMIYCVVGSRGTGALGAPCTGEGDCRSGVCNTPATGSAVCSDVCTASECAGSPLPNCRQLNTTPPVKLCLAN
jgi:hypothetical protein